MASSIALRRAAPATLLGRLLNGIRSASIAPSVTRSFNTNAQRSSFDDDEDRSVAVDRQSDRSISRRRDTLPGFFSDVLDPFSPSRSVSQLLNLMDQLMENPFVSASRGMGRRSWDVKEDNDALFLRMDMPGLGKADVKVSVEQNTLIIKGEGEKEADEDEDVRRYSSRIELPPNLYKVDSIKAEMRNGVLKVVVPKVKEEERKEVHQVKIE
ncbi:small heat shock protein, chloroplastic isoform X2 [Malania oleifera]|uniref:small heat shock protein, chloroplastic isoform X2 n=1 Tax=Malania oleifera TaxID=397392 RepID=UPI0025ADE1D7|nr:small heat shock protein, chloroplastic isoform X2 [Malania oleifera]